MIQKKNHFGYPDRTAFKGVKGLQFRILLWWGMC